MNAEHPLSLILRAIPYMSSWNDYSWVGVFLAEFNSPNSQVLEGPGSNFFDGPKPPGSRPWQPLKDEMHETYGLHFKKLEIAGDGTLQRRPAERDWKSYGVYVLSSSNGEFGYGAKRSPIWYIGTCSDGGWTRNRAFDHFFGPHADYSTTVFTTRKAKPQYGTISKYQHSVLLVEGLGSTHAAEYLESKLKAGFERAFDQLPLCNSR